MPHCAATASRTTLPVTRPATPAESVTKYATVVGWFHNAHPGTGRGLRHCAPDHVTVDATGKAQA
jgi:hypothetical protein